jgi:hypothetical protein
VHKTDVFITDDLNLIDQAKAAEVVTELLLCRALIKSAEIDITACVALTDGQRDLAWHGRRLAPSNLELLAMEGKFFDRGIGMERGGSGAIEEREENA